MSVNRSEARLRRFIPGESARALRDAARMNAPIEEIERLSRIVGRLGDVPDDPKSKRVLVRVLGYQSSTSLPATLGSGAYWFAYATKPIAFDTITANFNPSTQFSTTKPDGILVNLVEGESYAQTSTVTHNLRTGAVVLASPEGSTSYNKRPYPLFTCEIGASLPAGTLFAVNVSQNGGSNGTSTTVASYTYNVTSLASASLGTAMTPQATRYSKGAVTAATKGTGYYDSAGAFVLYEVFEQHGSGTC